MTQDFGEIIRNLKDKNSAVRRDAAEALGELGDARVVEPLAAALWDKDREVRWAAARALGKIGAPAVDLLIAALQDKDKDVRWVASWALGQIGDPQAVESLIAALQDKEWVVRQAARNALSEIGVPAVQPLVTALRDEDEDLRQAIVWVLAEIGEPALQEIITTLQDKSVQVQWTAVRALRYIGESQVVEPLIGALQSENEETRRIVAGALGELRDSRAVDPLIASLQDHNKSVRQAAAKALGKIRASEAVEPLIAALRYEDESTREAASEALGMIHDPRSVDRLISILEDSEQVEFVRYAAAETLGRIGGLYAVESLIPYLTDQNEDLCTAAAWALVSVGRPAVEPLISMLQDEEGHIRWAAARVLQEVGDSAVKPLVGALQSEDRDVRQIAAWTLGRIGDPRALEPLGAVRHDKELSVRQAAIRALEQIGGGRLEGKCSPFPVFGEEDVAEELICQLRRASRRQISKYTQPIAPHYSDVSFPAHTTVGQVEALRVAVTLTPISDQAIELGLEPSKEDEELLRVDVYVSVSPLDFDLQSPNIQTIEIPPDTDSAPVIFKLVSKGIGQKTIAVEFFQNARYLGHVEVETTVGEEPGATKTASTGSALELHSHQLAPDLTIFIEATPFISGRFLCRFSLFSPIHELDFRSEGGGQIELLVAPETYFETIFAELNEWLLERDVDGRVFFERLNSLGANLYDQLFPEELKHIYWENVRGKIKTLQIVSTDPWIPWELIRPYHPDTLEEDDFLCEQFALTRWLVGPPSPGVIDLRKLALVVAATDLASTMKEAEALKQLLGVQVQDIPPSLLDVYDLLAAGGFSALHFACHGEYDRQNPDQSVVLLEGNQRFRPNDIAGKKRAFGRDEPLVFLNACETGRGGLSLTGLGGWAKAFIKAGAGGFVGSNWAAHDESAYRFAVAFYHHLLEGKIIAEAARLARQSIKRAGDPTWLSYTVYANPLARLAVETPVQP